MTTFLQILSLIGSLGLFLYGMKIMSEGLEKFAGARLRSILAMMTHNRVMGVLTGILITALIQSSSATTVMVVSFVDSSLMTLTQAIGVIMGANIGTTVTAWIISAIGFKVNIVAFTIPLLALGLPLIFSGDSRRKNVGEFIFGFSFLFMGLNFLQSSAEALNISALVADLLSHVAGDNIFTLLLFIVVGALVTMIVQASAATMAIILMLFGMHIDGFGFHQAAAIAMGQNIGTTITALLASLTGGTQARRAALAHMSFNIFGVIVVLVLFYPFCDAVAWTCKHLLHVSSNELFLLSAFHTAFNVFNTLLLIPFVPQLERFVCMICRERDAADREPGLRFISGGLLSTAELSILEAKKEIGVFCERLLRMIDMVNALITLETGKEFEEITAKVSKYKQITANMEVEIANYLARVAEGRLSDKSKAEISRMLRTVSELESIATSINHLSTTLFRKQAQTPTEFTERQSTAMLTMLLTTRRAIKEMMKAVDINAGKNFDYTLNYSLEDRLNLMRDENKAQNIADINNHEYDYQLGTFYIDFISECERVGDYIINVLNILAPATK